MGGWGNLDLTGEIQRPRWARTAQVAGGSGADLEGRTVAHWGALAAARFFWGWGKDTRMAHSSPTVTLCGHEALASWWPAFASKFISVWTLV
jgi:hypothetical protein